MQWNVADVVLIFSKSGLTSNVAFLRSGSQQGATGPINGLLMQREYHIIGPCGLLKGKHISDGQWYVWWEYIFVCLCHQISTWDYRKNNSGGIDIYTVIIALIQERGNIHRTYWALSEFGGTVIRSSLSKETEQKMQEALHKSWGLMRGRYRRATVERSCSCGWAPPFAALCYYYPSTLLLETL